MQKAKMQNYSRHIASIGALLAGCVACGAGAQSYPTKTVRITSAYASGTGADLMTRLIAEKLSRWWGQGVVVEARPAGNGVLAIEAVKKSTPDGHDILVAGGGHLVISPILFRDLPYDTERDFAPVAALLQAPSMVAVSANGPYNSLGDIINAAKAKPGSVTFATLYIGSTQDIGGVMVELASKTQMLHVAFKENSQIFAAMINGDVGWTLTTIGSGQAFYKAGRIKYLAHTNKTPLAAFAKVPTMDEAGLSGMDFNVWAGFVVPRVTPTDRVAFVSRDINRAMAEADFQERAANLGVVSEVSTPASFGALIRSDIKVYADVIKRGNIKVEQ